MKKLSILLIIPIIILIAETPLKASKETFSNRMHSIVSDSEKGDEKLGIYVVSLNSGDTLYSHNKDARLNPASCTKLITTATALKLLGPSYKYHTEFYTDRRPVNGEVGLMWIKGSGDPSIVIERLWRIARDIANTGLKKINGDVILDDYYFDSYKYPGYIPGSGRAYNSLTGALSLNYNTITIIVSPSSRVGAPPNIALDTAGPYFRVINSAKTGPRGSKQSISVSRKNHNGEDIIHVTGSIPVQYPPQYVYRNITNPPLYFGLALKSLLEQNGIEVTGRIKRQLAPRGGYLLLDSLSKSLSLIVRDMNKHSNNFVAEQLVKTLAAEIGGGSGNTAKGIQIIKNYLSELGIPENDYVLVNGSGLTTKNRITADTLIKVLSNTFTDFRIAPEVMSSFSIAGVDGTIKNRHKSDNLRGLARAKTGSLSGVSTLVGTVPSNNGELIGYVILMNGSVIGWTESHKIQESMLNAMASFTR